MTRETCQQQQGGKLKVTCVPHRHNNLLASPSNSVPPTSRNHRTPPAKTNMRTMQYHVCPNKIHIKIAMNCRSQYQNPPHHLVLMLAIYQITYFEWAASKDAESSVLWRCLTSYLYGAKIAL